ncbi:hypothetical protein P5673_018620 [Acropora cervicornis]|uniref:Transposase Helix-turn-helix domain-containing protein n=1 Tax=Acropora cervicornis TaxID=6130 RepID=A0AAD9V2R6_ACRCE|nr:hypothetical protein P5673_018620 [Acropora cervicornis]
MDISDNSTAMCASVDAETQTEEYDYMSRSSKYQAPDHEYFHSDKKVRYYSGLPSYEILMVVFHHVAPHQKKNVALHLARITKSLKRFHEFMIALIKLRHNVPLEDLAFQFMVFRPTVSRIFAHWIVVMDIRLRHDLRAFQRRTLGNNAYVLSTFLW